MFVIYYRNRSGSIIETMLSNKETSKFYVSLPDDSLTHYGNSGQIPTRPANVSSDAHAEELLDIPDKSNSNNTSNLIIRLSSEDESTKRTGMNLTNEFIYIASLTNIF